MTGENGAKFGAGWTPLEWGGASYDFITKRNSVTFTLPSDWSGASYSLTGAVTSSGYGAEAGAHRSIGRVNGESPNLAAVSRSYDYSVLPKIVIPVHQKPKSDIYATTGDWIYKNTQNPIVSSTGGEWAVIGLARAGYAVSDGYYASYASNVISTLIKNNGVLHAKKYIEYSRAVLALTAIGYDVTNVGGYNLLDRLADFDAVCWQGVNGPIWALLALDSHGCEIPVAPSFKTRTTREKLVSAILEKELTSGGWTLAGNAADVDMTAMAIQALAPYYNALNEAEQKHVAGYPLLTAAERKYTQLENAQRVIELIDAIGTVTKNSADKIDAARSAYDALSNAEKTLVTNYSVLTAAERKLTALVAGGSTKVIGNGNTKLSLNGITYMVDAEAATLMKQIDTLTKAKKLNMKLLATAYTAYMDMSDKLKAQVINYGDLEALTNKAGEENHTDAATGIQIEDAPWYVKINVKKSVDKSVSDIIKNSIGSNEMLMLWDINLINMLEGAEYYPDASITLSAPADDLSRFSQVRIAHYDGSKNEYLDCTVADGRITWQTQSFSTFAVIASEAATLNELENSDKPSVMAATSPEAQAESPMWVIVLIFALTAAGIAAMAVVIILKRKAKR